MIVLALLLLIAAAALVVFVIVTGSTQPVALEWDALNLAWDPSVLVVFLLGAVTLLLVVVAFGLLRGGTRRKVEQRRELRRLRRVERENAAVAGASTSRGDGPQSRPAADRPAHDTASSPSAAPGQEGATQAQPPVYPRRTEDTPASDPSASRDQAGTGTPPAGTPDTSAQGSWHDEPGTEGTSGRHEAR